MSQLRAFSSLTFLGCRHPPCPMSHAGQAAPCRDIAARGCRYKESCLVCGHPNPRMAMLPAPCRVGFHRPGLRDPGTGALGTGSPKPWRAARSRGRFVFSRLLLQGASLRGRYGPLAS